MQLKYVVQFLILVDSILNWEGKSCSRSDFFFCLSEWPLIWLDPGADFGEYWVRWTEWFGVFQSLSRILYLSKISLDDVWAPVNFPNGTCLCQSPQLYCFALYSQAGSNEKPVFLRKKMGLKYIYIKNIISYMKIQGLKSPSVDQLLLYFGGFRICPVSNRDLHKIPLLVFASWIHIWNDVSTPLFQ